MSEYAVIFETRDDWGTVRVLDDGECRVLAFGDNDEQSKLDKKQHHVPRHSYVQVMLESLMFKSPKSAIVLGLGGGALIHALRRYDAAIKFTAVELRGAVIEVAKRFFFLPVGKKLQLIEGDAIEFIASGEHKRVDVIYADLFSVDGVADGQLSEAFIEGTLRLLKDDGMLVLNCWKEHRQNPELAALLNRHFAQVFASLTSGGNWVIFASRTANVIREDGLKQARAELSSRLDFNVGKSSLSFGPWQF
ncbi:spermidine synthase [Shewanella sp. JM162201]|uniref:Spermidine synthase n=1 Tax=Shewanella jiangmenensis TaxID=2837387 RepID=A0ABS5V3K7_9GAMM|nr:spermidine synthase [Shewanella jiangmenensis]MBT1444274.1 spermidine synthase [Shewanella jiangmenensis]